MQPPGRRRGTRERVITDSRIAVPDLSPTERESEAEFGRRLAREMPVLLRLARRLCGRADEAAELGQDAARRALERRGSFDPKRPLRGWLLRLAFRVWLDGRARTAVRATASPAVDDARAGGLDEVDRATLQE